jgi:hypothetical protein
MCLTRLARKINIYNRIPSKITFVDTFATYGFIIALLVVIYVYTHRYYHLVELDIDLCQKDDSKYNCIKGEVINVVVPYIGVMFGFTQSLYMITDKIALCLNYVLCCIYCCKNNNPNLTLTNSDIESPNTPTSVPTIELNKI